MVEIDIFNTAKSRLETVRFEYTDKNTTWFDDCQNNDDIYRISDMDGGLLIKDCGYDYPLWIYGLSRKDINYDKQKAANLKKLYTE